MNRVVKRILFWAAVIAVLGGACAFFRMKEPYEGVIVEVFHKPNPKLRATGYGEPIWHFRLHYWKVRRSNGKVTVVELPYMVWRHGEKGDRVRQTRFGPWPETVEKAPQESEFRETRVRSFGRARLSFIRKPWLSSEERLYAL